MTDENQRIRLLVYDALLLQQVDPFVAAPIAQQVGAELRRNEDHEQLYVVRVTDHQGNPHDCVTSQVNDISVVVAGPIDIAGLRAAVRQEVAEERAVDARLQNSGTVI